MRFAEINLSKKSVKVKKIRNDFAKKWIGGNGFGINWLLKYTPKKVNALSSKNALIFATGPMTGTAIPTSGKCGVFFKSPQTNAFGESYSGGHFGAELRYSQLIGLVIIGTSRKPVYIWIDDDNIEIRDAKGLWGLDTFETEKQVKRETDNNASVATIGEAGENLVSYACIQNDYGRNFGRCGAGCVMGSKKLKAIAVKGSGDVEVSNFKGIQKFVEIWNSMIRDHPDFLADTGCGTGEFIKWMSDEKGGLPTRNFQQGVFERVEGLNPYKWSPKYSIKNKACFACNKPCGRLFKGFDFVFDGPEYETLYSLGSNCGISDVQTVAKAHYLCDKYGLDAISAGAVIAWAMECSEKGLIKTKLRFGDNSFLKMIPKIAKKQGLGETLALGVRKASKVVGKDSDKLTIETKGLEYPGYDIRGMKGLGLGFAVSTRGGCHLRSCFYAVDLTGGFGQLNFKNVDRFSTKGKPRMVKAMEDLLAIYDSLILCKFSRKFFPLKDLSQLLTWTTGFNYRKGDILKIGSEIMKKEFAFNRREGLTEKDDTIAWRMMNEPSPKGKSKGSLITEEELEGMKRKYYKLRGI